ncbi:MAG: hypothetical protein ACRDTU_22720 [Micromonosporaceae bacterium]
MSKPSPAAVQALRQHVRRFNEGVRTGDFAQMVTALHIDAESDTTSATGEYAWSSGDARRAAGRITVNLAPDQSLDTVEIDYYNAPHSS